MKVLCVALLLALANGADAETIIGRVVAVADGDTLTVLDGSNHQHKIRLAGIDAPETSQPFGKQAKHHLESLALNHDVTVDWNKLDRYKRKVGKVLLDGVDINLEQLNAGMAWWYKKYRKEQSDADQHQYYEAEQSAIANSIGLWNDPSRIQPWIFRKMPK